MPGQRSKKHHYIPAFYLRQWDDADGLIYEFSRPHVAICSRRCAATATGFQQHLYTLDNLPADHRVFLEDVFLKRVDQLASDALGALSRGMVDQLPVETLSGWSRFIISLHHRSPESLAALKSRSSVGLEVHLKNIENNYSEFRRESDPVTFEEARLLLGAKWSDGFLAKLFTTVVDSGNVMSHINGMKWRVMRLTNTERTFLTSDRPIVRTSSIHAANDFLMMPIGPKELYLAVNDESTFQRIKAEPVADLVTLINDHVCRAASKYVYSADERQARFVENRLRRACNVEAQNGQ
jgi:hypothetical protein